MRIIIPIIFLAFVPTLAALGHDAYLYYMHQENGFMLSTFGFIWTEYHPQSYEQMLEGLSEEQVEILTAILGRKTVELTGAFGVILSCLIIVIKLIFMLFSGLSHMSMNAKKQRS